MLALAIISPSPPFPVWSLSPLVKLGPLLSLAARVGLIMMFLVSHVVPFFHGVACLIIKSIIRLFKLFTFGGSSCPSASLLACSPPPTTWA
jgi:hypothetical protein